MPYWDEVESEVPSGELKSLSAFFPGLLGKWALANELAPSCESEIEVDLGVRITEAFKVINDETLSLVPQYALGRFRYDFAITRRGRPKPIALIECDGKEFHQTEEQLVNDRAKNNLAAKEEIYLFRFSGSEIFRHLDECVGRILKMMRFQGHLSQEQRDTLESAGFRRR